MQHAPVDTTPETIRLYYYTTKRWALKILWERRLKIAEYAELNDPFETLPFGLADRRAGRFWAERVAALQAGDHGVVCFAADWRVPQMWAQYAERHTGICLGFDVPRAVAEPVHYLERPLADPFVGDRAAARRLAPAVLEAALRHKPAVWRHEQEWRVRARLTPRHDGIGYLPFDAGIDLREIILGARCTLVPRDVVEAVASPPLDVEVYAATPAREAFAIERHELVETHRIAGFRTLLAAAPDAYWHQLGDPG